MATCEQLTTGQLQVLSAALLAQMAGADGPLADQLRHSRRLIRAELDRRGVTV